MKALEQYTVLCFVPSSRGWDGIIRQARRAGPSPSRPAGRSRPRVPAPLFTVRRDLDGHVGLDVMGDARPWSSRPAWGREGTCRPGRGPAALGCGARVPPRDPAAHDGACGDSCSADAQQGCDRPPRGPCGDVRGRAARAGARQGRAQPPWPDGGYPITPGISQRPPWAKQANPGHQAWVRRGRSRIDARTAAYVFCAGVLCGPCVAPCSPWGPPPRRRGVVPRGALRLCTDDGQWARFNECASSNSVSAAAGARHRLESDWMHGSAC